ncbi:Alpha/Beta hydrolase protein [Talaromyces proteolyticus]|uniref:Alpha/Beta hydrolase protein n=1 Tax=Talaromyces proteolyticus TaxID=1131652 RepID=A0AAD4KGL9_9EURO|nr:Alpha/Beta hydrolase protein [Talaromyces proteolyticus]KAH8689052.1 Alpha/Beta hydrolase protein [Talaromyces proteolyticus]
MAASSSRFLNPGPIHPARVAKRAIKSSIARSIRITVNDPLDHEAPAILHEPKCYTAEAAKLSAVILISGAGGGVSGPAGIYPSLAEKLVLLLSIPCIRLDYREPAKTSYCSADVIAAMDHLAVEFSSEHFVLVGWSFGGSPCFTVAAKEPRRVAGVATVASQTAQTEGVTMLCPRPMLVMHGTGDTCLSPSCSESLYRSYGPGGKRVLKLFDGDDHGLSRNAVAVEKMIFEFAARILGFEEILEDPSANIQVGQDLAGSRGERLREMAEGHDLEGGERL